MNKQEEEQFIDYIKKTSGQSCTGRTITAPVPRSYVKLSDQMLKELQSDLEEKGYEWSFDEAELPIAYFPSHNGMNIPWPWEYEAHGFATSEAPAVLGLTYPMLLNLLSDGYPVIMDVAAAQKLKARHAANEGTTDGYVVSLKGTSDPRAAEVSFEYDEDEEDDEDENDEDSDAESDGLLKRAFLTEDDLIGFTEKVLEGIGSRIDPATLREVVKGFIAAKASTEAEKQ